VTTTETLHEILTTQGRTVRDGQAIAAELIDSGAQHVALQAPTGVGKSALAVATAIAAGGGVVAMHSNGLILQYMEEAEAWEEATGARVVSLVGKGHYWCPKASSDLNGLPEEVKVHVRGTGTFLGSGVEQAEYRQYTALALDSVSEEEEAAGVTSVCTKCPHRETGCPLWAARSAAAAADVVVTNATMLGVAVGGFVEWAQGILKKVIVLDEAHADIDPIASVLGHQITIKGQRAVEAAASIDEALAVVHEWAGIPTARKHKDAKRFIAALKVARREGRFPLHSVDETEGKVVLTIPADLTAAFAERRVVALSATLSQRNVNDLGLDAQVVSLPGLDVSASTVFVDNDAPAWAWVRSNGDQHSEWAQHVAAKLTDAFRNGGATLGLFVSKDDLHAVVALLPEDVRKGTLHYYSGVDRKATIDTYRADPKNHMIVGCVSGAGTGVNLPGDLLRTVVVSRVPQNAPKGADRGKWAEDTRAAVVQSVGRAHRFDGDWGHVHIVGGFGVRADVRKSLDELGWVIK